MHLLQYLPSIGLIALSVVRFIKIEYCWRRYTVECSTKIKSFNYSNLQKIDFVMKFSVLILFFLLAGLALKGQSPLIRDTVFISDPGDKNWVTCEVYTQSGALFQKGSLYKGQKMGLWRTWNAFQRISSMEEYRNGILNGVRYEFDPNGYFEKEENYINGKLNGKKIKWQFGNQVTFEENYLDGLLNGEIKAFYENNQRQEEANYKNGKRDGISKWFFDDGSISIQYTYKNGILDGPALTYWRNGKLQSEGNYSDNLEQGEWKEYNEEGELIKTTRYEKGKKLN